MRWASGRQPEWSKRIASRAGFEQVEKAASLRSRLGVAVGVLLLAGTAAFPQQPTPPGGVHEPPKIDEAAVARGKTAFQSNCGFCHGEDARGGRAPDLIRSTLVNHDEGGNLIAPVIRNGRPDKGMPAFPALKANEIDDIVAFLHNSAHEALHSGHVSSDYPLEKLLTGNAAAGKAYFNGPGGCVKCHSVTGDLAGIAKKYSPVDLQQHMVYPARAAAPTAVVTTADGKKYEGEVKRNDEFTIAIAGKDGWFRSWPRSDVKVEIDDPLAGHRKLMERYTDADIHNLFAYLETLK
jgi:cytochrome c oxidase cbb3-type subunit 3